MKNKNNSKSDEVINDFTIIFDENFCKYLPKIYNFMVVLI